VEIVGNEIMEIQMIGNNKKKKRKKENGNPQDLDQIETKNVEWGIRRERNKTRAMQHFEGVS
jgi:hypothetical protein